MSSKRVKLFGDAYEVSWCDGSVFVGVVRNRFSSPCGTMVESLAVALQETAEFVAEQAADVIRELRERVEELEREKEERS